MKKALLTTGSITIAVIILVSCAEKPEFEIPPSASDVKLLDEGGWQSRKFVLRFDDSPESCREFAISLMKRHMGEDVGIMEETFSKFPISWRGFPDWFDVDRSVANGTLITGDEWIYAVVDKDQGRLYYYYSH